MPVQNKCTQKFKISACWRNGELKTLEIFCFLFIVDFKCIYSSTRGGRVIVLFLRISAFGYSLQPEITRDKRSSLPLLNYFTQNIKTFLGSMQSNFDEIYHTNEINMQNQTILPEFFIVIVCVSVFVHIDMKCVFQRNLDLMGRVVGIFKRCLMCSY